MKAPKKSEKDLLEDYLVERLDKHNIFHIKGNPKGAKGFPDRMVFAKMIYFVELKLGKENNSYYKQTPMQKKWQDQIEQTGNFYLLLQSRAEIEDFIKSVLNSCIYNNVKNHFAYNKNIIKNE